ncbi:hypothetical protein MNV49_004827 [Pseudohyphozyma bogoriensis]|nr:hypothetical protein MNV49_004827 [Pseudohyphozyma bogoriensis]
MLEPAREDGMSSDSEDSSVHEGEFIVERIMSYRVQQELNDPHSDWYDPTLGKKQWQERFLVRDMLKAIHAQNPHLPDPFTLTQIANRRNEELRASRKEKQKQKKPKTRPSPIDTQLTPPSPLPLPYLANILPDTAVPDRNLLQATYSAPPLPSASAFGAHPPYPDPSSFAPPLHHAPSPFSTNPVSPAFSLTSNLDVFMGAPAPAPIPPPSAAPIKPTGDLGFALDEDEEEKADSVQPDVILRQLVASPAEMSPSAHGAGFTIDSDEEAAAADEDDDDDDEAPIRPPKRRRLLPLTRPTPKRPTRSASATLPPPHPRPSTSRSSSTTSTPAGVQSRLTSMGPVPRKKDGPSRKTASYSPPPPGSPNGSLPEKAVDPRPQAQARKLALQQALGYGDRRPPLGERRTSNISPQPEPVNTIAAKKDEKGRYHVVNTEALETKLNRLDHLWDSKMPSLDQRICRFFGVGDIEKNFLNLDRAMKGKVAYIHAPQRFVKIKEVGDGKQVRTATEDFETLQYLLAKRGIQQSVELEANVTAIFVHVSEEHELGNYPKLEDFRANAVFVLFGRKDKERHFQRFWSTSAAITFTPKAILEAPEATRALVLHAKQSSRRLPGLRDKFCWIPLLHVVERGPFYIPPKKCHQQRADLASSPDAEATFTVHELIRDRHLDLTAPVPMSCTNFEGRFPLAVDCSEYSENEFRAAETVYGKTSLMKTDLESISKQVGVWKKRYLDMLSLFFPLAGSWSSPRVRRLRQSPGQIEFRTMREAEATN